MAALPELPAVNTPDPENSPDPANGPGSASTPGSAGAPGPVVVLARARFGVVGERRRVCHVFPLPAGAGVPQEWSAYCGATFRPGELEQFSEIVGMPCEVCLLRCPLPPGTATADAEHSEPAELAELPKLPELPELPGFLGFSAAVVPLGGGVAADPDTDAGCGRGGGRVLGTGGELRTGRRQPDLNSTPATRIRAPAAFDGAAGAGAASSDFSVNSWERGVVGVCDPSVQVSVSLGWDSGTEIACQAVCSRFADMAWKDGDARFFLNVDRELLRELVRQTTCTLDTLDHFAELESRGADVGDFQITVNNPGRIRTAEDVQAEALASLNAVLAEQERAEAAAPCHADHFGLGEPCTDIR